MSMKQRQTARYADRQIGTKRPRTEGRKQRKQGINFNTGRRHNARKMYFKKMHEIIYDNCVHISRDIYYAKYYGRGGDLGLGTCKRFLSPLVC